MLIARMPIEELKQKLSKHLSTLKINDVEILHKDRPCMLYCSICTVAVDTKSTISSVLWMMTGPVMCNTM